MHRRLTKRNEKDNFSCQQHNFNHQTNKILTNLRSTKERSKKFLIEEQWLMHMEDLEGDQEHES
jgi:hypothetical protein